MVSANLVADLRDEYDVNESETINSPGKFEGEHISIPYFWDCILNGDCESAFDGDQTYYFLVIGESDLEMFPDLKDRYGVCVCEDKQGYVYAIWFDNASDYNEAKENPDEL